MSHCLLHETVWQFLCVHFSAPGFSRKDNQHSAVQQLHQVCLKMSLLWMFSWHCATFPAVNAHNCVDTLTANLPGMWERTVTIGSGGKSFSATGWKVTHNDWLLAIWGRSSVQVSPISFLFFCFILGWVGHRLWEHHHSFKSPAPVIGFWLRHCCSGDHTTPKMHESQRGQIFFLICPWRLLQEAVAQGFEREYKLFGSPDSYFQQLPALLQKKRDTLSSSLRTAGFKPIVPEGGYYLTADISCVSKSLDQFHFGQWQQI